jgi:hypothetical protein
MAVNEAIEARDMPNSGWINLKNRDEQGRLSCKWHVIINSAFSKPSCNEIKSSPSPNSQKKLKSRKIACRSLHLHRDLSVDFIKNFSFALWMAQTMLPKIFTRMQSDVIAFLWNSTGCPCSIFTEVIATTRILFRNFLWFCLHGLCQGYSYECSGEFHCRGTKVTVLRFDVDND